ncbi:MAG: MarR family transcriptional regulator [Lachnospiraceae bacterium]|nr:MarR family transcriptional regulator [Lachnospiraceae bacterium]MDD3661185.1 MarR family transcriptional regulator [Lachnospiraceae bacterium]
MLYKEIGRNILIIDKYFKLYLKTALKQYDLNTAEGMVLLTLYEQTGHTSAQIIQNSHPENFSATQNQLIDELHYDKGVMTRIIQSLEQKGFVRRTDHPLDSRSFLINVTDKALDFKPVLISILKRWNDLFLIGFDEASLDMLDKSLVTMAENAAVATKEGDIQ